jgi:circadian clock protein KaiB
MAKRKSKSPARHATAEFERLFKDAGPDHYVLRLYVTGITAKSAMAIANIRSLCDEYLPGRHDLEVIDIYQQPIEAIGSQIIAAPTLVKQYPTPVRKMIGDLTDRKRVLLGLDIKKPSERKTKSAEAIKWVEL